MFGKISTGAMNDLEKITKQSYAMIAYFGMSNKVGHVSFYDSSGQTDMTFTKPYSEKTAELIDKEVKDLIEEAYKRSFEILKKHKDDLTQLAEILLEKEVIFSEDLERIFGKRPWKTQHEKEAEVKKELEEKEKKRKTELKPSRLSADLSAEQAGKAGSTSGESKKVERSEKEEKAEEDKPARSVGRKETTEGKEKK